MRCRHFADEKEEEALTNDSFQSVNGDRCKLSQKHLTTAQWEMYVAICAAPFCVLISYHFLNEVEKFQLIRENTVG